MKNISTLLFVFLLVFLAGCEDEFTAKGHRIFNRYCMPCHGESGDGTGYNAVNLDPQPRDLTDSAEEYMVKLSNEEIYEVLEVGGYGVDLSAAMPAWGKVFSEEELWSLVAYVRTLHSYEDEPIVFTKPDSKERVFDNEKPRYPRVRPNVFDDLLESMVPDEEALEEQIALGEEIFAELGCNGCHVINGEGGELGPDLTRVGFMLQTNFMFRWMLNPQSFKAKTRMPNLDLNEEDALAISLYLSTLRDSPEMAGSVIDSNNEDGEGDT
ncbi:MAG: c-type cytochrome [Nitrospiria bacterium]